MKVCMLRLVLPVAVLMFCSDSNLEAPAELSPAG